MPTVEPIRLLILETSRNRAEELIVLLRTAGRATRAHQIKSSADLKTKLAEQTWDLLIGITAVRGLSLAQSIKIISEQGKDVPAIMIAEDQDPAAITAGLKIGAKDVALQDDDERFLMIINRELTNLNLRRQLRLSEVRLRETERRNQLLLASSTAAIAYVHEGMHIYTNQAYGDLFGFDDADDFVGIPIIDLIAPPEQAKFKTFLKSYQGREQEPETLNCVTSSNTQITTSLTLSAATYDGEYCTQVMFKALAEDVELEQRLREIASQDLQTGLYNRAYFVEQLDIALDSARQGKQSWVMFYIRIDDFDDLQSEAGISNADLVLGNLAALIRGTIDETHIIAKFGDDVFTLLYRGGDKDVALELGKDLSTKVERHIAEVSGKSFQTTVSIGMALISENSPSGEEIISRSHQAAVARPDGNHASFYQAEKIKIGADGQALNNEAIQELLSEALKENLFKVLYQPIISLHGNDNEQYEALLRVLDEDGNELYPGQFLPAAEQAGLLEKIDRWVILHTLQALAYARKTAPKSKLFINITHRSMSDKSFLPWVAVALKAAKLPHDVVIFQIHENDATSYLKQVTKFTKGVAALGCKVSINHFGCSLHPFNLLKHLSPDYVKLDGSFASAIESSTEKQEELINMVGALQSKGTLTAISGVENPIVLSTLWQAKLDYIQGYYISQPLDEMDYDFTSEAL